MTISDRVREENTLPAITETDKVAEAYRQYMRTDLTLVELAVELSLDAGKLALWAKNGAWAERKKAVTEEVLALEDSAYKEWWARNRIAVRKEQMVQIRRAQDVLANQLSILEKSPEKLVPSKVLSTIINMVDKMAQAGLRATGCGTDAGDGMSGVSGPGQGRVPLISLNVGELVTVSRENGKPAIDVAEEKEGSGTDA